jgi:hypothetical protein
MGEGERSDRPLTVITGDRKTRERRAGRRRALDQNEQITCWRCKNDIGIATSIAGMIRDRYEGAGALISYPTTAVFIPK